MRETLEELLTELSELSKRGASERELETDIVGLFRQIGWSRTQIKQDVPLTPRGIDRADIVIRADERHSILIEVKGNGELRGAEEQVRRYCMLLTPRPRIAFLTDGTQWSVFYTSHSEVRKLFSGDVGKDIGTILDLLLVVTPERMGESDFGLRFDFLDAIDHGLSRLNTQEQLRLLPCYITTVLSLLGAELPTVITEIKLLSPTVEPKAVLLKEPQPETPETELTMLDLRNPPLRYSKMRGTIGDVEVTSWRSAVHIAIKFAFDAGMSATEIRNISFVNMREEHFVEDGFAPVVGTPFCVQAMESNRSWSSAFCLLKRLNTPVDIAVNWTEKANDNWHGKQGILRWTPTD